MFLLYMLMAEVGVENNGLCIKVHFMSYNPEGENARVKSEALLRRGDLRVIILRRWLVIYREENFHQAFGRLLNSSSPNK